MPNETKQIVLVTGGNGDIGFAIVNELQLSGWHVVAPSSKELDLSSAASVQSWLEQVQETTFSAVVACAGINMPALLKDIQIEEFERTLQVNFRGHMQILDALLPRMIKTKDSRIVFISSAYSQKARKGRGAYSISKAALDAYMRVLALEYSEFGVLVNSVAPGFVNTSLTRKNNSQNQIDSLTKRIPLGRLADPSEISKLVSFLCSTANTYITGQTINIDGGFSVQ